MKRRSVIKSLALGFGSLGIAPAWANGWTSQTVQAFAFLPPNENALLAEVTETIIPETTTAGAKSMKIHDFVQRMVYDCYGDDAIQLLKQGLVTIDQKAQEAHKQPFIQCDKMQRQVVLSTMMADEQTKGFAQQLKDLTVWGYTTSEFFMNTYTEYNMAPGFYKGCVPVV